MLLAHRGLGHGCSWGRPHHGPAQCPSCTKYSRCSTRRGCSRVRWVHDWCSITRHWRPWANMPFSECMSAYRKVTFSTFTVLCHYGHCQSSGEIPFEDKGKFCDKQKHLTNDCNKHMHLYTLTPRQGARMLMLIFKFLSPTFVRRFTCNHQAPISYRTQQHLAPQALKSGH